MLNPTYPFYLAGKPISAGDTLPVIDKYSLKAATHVYLASGEEIDAGIAAANQAREPMRRLRPYERKKILEHCVAKFRDRFDELAMSLCIEAGKPIRDAKGEVNRLIDTFQIAAEESVRIGGEVMNLEVSERARGYRGMYQKVPIGTCSFISPFNFPLNLAAHKIAPAIAAGCPFVLKPASKTPIGALLIGEILTETELPSGAFSILPCHRNEASAFITDERIKLLSFTGSPDVGWELKTRAGKKKVVLELGGNAACVVDKGVDLDDTVERILIGAFYQSGQSCISVQRLIIHESIYEEIKTRLINRAQELICGDPKNEATFIGPMISENDAIRLEHWVANAISMGGKLLCGGRRSGAIFNATLLEEVPRNAEIYSKEAFGPIAVLSKFQEFDEAIKEVNDSQFGLQAGVFTRDIYHIQQAWDEMEVGGVIIGDVPSWRVDHMPYGGVKDSGLGREGVRFAIEEMSEVRNLVIRTP